MATLSRGKTFGATEQVTNTKLHTLVDSGSISSIDQADLAASRGLVITSASSPSDTDALWRDSGNSNVIKYHDGSAWTRISPATTVPPQYRNGLFVSRSGAETLAVDIGDIEVNETIVSKTSATTLALGTAADWAGGASLQAVSTYGYIGIDASGNIKMHTTTPSHSDYDLTVTAGVKRYASWSSTTYRIIGWFFMNATGSGEVDTWGISNLRDTGVPNSVVRTGTTTDTINDVAYGTDLTESQVEFYATGQRPVKVTFNCQALNADNNLMIILDIGGNIAVTERSAHGATTDDFPMAIIYEDTLAEGTHTIKVQAQVSGGSDDIADKILTVTEL